LGRSATVSGALNVRLSEKMESGVNVENVELIKSGEEDGRF